MIRTRYAPSPTGFMHIGNLRTALYEYLIAKHDNNGVFILRIEDTDQDRYIEGAADAIYNTLALTGLHFDEGPIVGGNYGPYIQSERKADYLPHAVKLVETGNAYYCFCNKERLDTLADERGLKRYDRHCLKLSKDEIQANLDAGVSYIIRQLIPEGQTTFHDEVFGDITIDNKEMEDQVLIKSDGMPTYNFANVVDDHAMAITHVVRGSEYLTSTPKYKLLYDAFGWETPIYVHLPLLQNATGQKISKRHGDASIQELLNMGFLPEAIINYAALLGWSPSESLSNNEKNENREIFSLDELIKIFDVKNISKSPSTFDMVKLTWVNGEHIKAMPFEQYCKLAIPFLQEAVKKQGIDYNTLAQMTQSRVAFIKECGELVDFIDSLPQYDIALFSHKKMKTNPDTASKALIVATTAFESIDNWNNDTLSQAVVNATTTSGLTKGQILWSVRTAVSGKPTTPCGATEVCVLLGKQETLRRLALGLDKLAQ